MDTAKIKETILQSANEASRLHAELHKAHQRHHESPETRDAWIQAAHEFNSRYNVLVFPGGYEGALDRLLAGDTLAMEAAICFLELRPYFFRSGYMFKDLLRKSRKAPLSTEQRTRLAVIETALREWRKRKQLTGTPSAHTHSLRTSAHGN